MDTGTLFQLRNVINRRNVITDVSKDLTACKEFMQLATIAHVMSAAIHIAGVTNMSELSSKIMSTDKPMAAVKSLVKTLISEMVRIEYIAGTSESTCPSISSVQEYAKETLSLGLLLLEFKDGIRERGWEQSPKMLEIFSSFFSRYYIKITAQKHSTYRCSITISCPNGMLNRCCGAASSTVRVDLDTTYQLTYTWNTCSVSE